MSTDLAVVEKTELGFTNSIGFEMMQRAANLLSNSTIVPESYRAINKDGKKNVSGLANCVVALNMANRIGADPLMVMQHLVIIHGRPTWSATFLIATVNTCGKFTALRYEFFGDPGKDDWGCRAWATEKATGEKLVGTDVTIGIAKKEGWYSKNGSKWQSIPQQMLMYRAASWWCRAYSPELSMGLQTADEARDIIDLDQHIDGTFSAPQTVDDLNAEIMTVEIQKAPEAEPVETVKIPCPERDGDLMFSDFCQGCDHRPGCPAWD